MSWSKATLTQCTITVYFRFYYTFISFIKSPDKKLIFDYFFFFFGFLKTFFSCFCVFINLHHNKLVGKIPHAIERLKTGKLNSIYILFDVTKIFIWLYLFFFCFHQKHIKSVWSFLSFQLRFFSVSYYSFIQKKKIDFFKIWIRFCFHNQFKHLFALIWLNKFI